MTLKELRSFIRLNTSKEVDDTILDALINVAKNELFDDVNGVEDIVYTTPTESLIKVPDMMLTLDKVELDGIVLDRLYQDYVYDIPSSYETPTWKSVVLGGRVIT